jgi:FAD:protein FMN transferase
MRRAVRLMGTVFSFDLRTPLPAPQVEAALDEAVGWLRWVDGTFSTYKETSEVNRFDRGELEIGEFSSEMREVFGLCHRYSEVTRGYFDAWAGGRYDPSGVVKGWSVERASRILAAAGAPDHVIDGGGDVRLSGAPNGGRGGATEEWHVGVRHPLRKDCYCAALAVSEGAVATSGTYERGLHVLDPFTGRAARQLASVTVTGPDLTSADAYATAALAMGPAAPGWLEGLEGYESQVVTPAGRGWSTKGFKELLSCA